MIPEDDTPAREKRAQAKRLEEEQRRCSIPLHDEWDAWKDAAKDDPEHWWNEMREVMRG